MQMMSNIVQKVKLMSNLKSSGKLGIDSSDMDTENHHFDV